MEAPSKTAAAPSVPAPASTPVHADMDTCASSSGGSGADSKAAKCGGSTDIHPSIADDERNFYLKAYPTTDLVRDRKVHCTVCKVHIGTAPSQEAHMKMHPILRVTHCNKCHDFYNSGEFSKGEDGSELYCRWCGQGGEVYCCSNCPYVFCKSCIVKNLSRGVVADIEQNENWRCFSCAPKILWPLRAQHWALINYIDKQKKSIKDANLPEAEYNKQMSKDTSTCCRVAKAKFGTLSDSMESLDSIASRRSHGSGSGSSKKLKKPAMGATPAPEAKRQKTSNDEVVCTPDLLSMLEPDCQITVAPKPAGVAPTVISTPKIMSIQTNYGGPQQTTIRKNSTPPPLVLRNTGIQMRPCAPTSIVRRTVVGPRTPTPGGSNTPVYHTINGYRIDLNTAAQQETFRLPNGKLIQVKRQGSSLAQNPPAGGNWANRANTTTIQRPYQIGPASAAQAQQYQAVTIQQTPANNSSSSNHSSHSNHSTQVTQYPHVLRYHNTVVGNTTVTSIGMNGSQASSPQVHAVNGTPTAPVQSVATPTVRPLMVRHIFPDTAIGQARSQLQDQVFNAMEICQHLTSKVQTLTHSNAYKQARNYLEVKELYIHLSYLLTYAIGRFKGLQDKCLGDMRQLGFVTDADSLENGQLAAGVDYVRYGQLEDVDLFNTGANSFHNQIYEYRKSLLDNLTDSEDGGGREPLSPLMPLGGLNDDNAADVEAVVDGAAEDATYNENADDHDDDDGDEDEDETKADDDNDDDQWATLDDIQDEPPSCTDQLEPIEPETEEAFMDDQQQDDVVPVGEETAEIDEYDADGDGDDDGDGDGDGDGNGDGDGDGEEDDNEDTSYVAHGIFGVESSRKKRKPSTPTTNLTTEEFLSRGEESHAYDRRLTRLIAQYPSIWCTKHPDYGNFDVTRKQWRTVAAHFKRNDNIKLRWKNIRKRFVRIERRLREGKRFNGYFDKATNFLTNRDRHPNEWKTVDCGEGDGDLFERKQLDKMERALHRNRKGKAKGKLKAKAKGGKHLHKQGKRLALARTGALVEDPASGGRVMKGRRLRVPSVKPIDLLPLDVKIINFVKSNPVLWRIPHDPSSGKIDEQTRRSLWLHLWKSMPSLSCDEIIDRWHHLYEMYKTFRLKSISDKALLANLELKYAKYLAKLYFLYKIDEDELQHENIVFQELCLGDDELEVFEESRLRELPDDRDFVEDLVRQVELHPPLWDKLHLDYFDTDTREAMWHEVADKLHHYKRDIRTMKLRWLLAKFSYSRLQRERKLTANSGALLLKYCQNLPIDEMSFLRSN